MFPAQPQASWVNQKAERSQLFSAAAKQNSPGPSALPMNQLFRVRDPIIRNNNENVLLLKDFTFGLHGFGKLVSGH